MNITPEFAIAPFSSKTAWDLSRYALAMLVSRLSCSHKGFTGGVYFLPSHKKGMSAASSLTSHLKRSVQYLRQNCVLHGSGMHIPLIATKCHICCTHEFSSAIFICVWSNKHYGFNCLLQSWSILLLLYRLSFHDLNESQWWLKPPTYV